MYARLYGCIFGLGLTQGTHSLDSSTARASVALAPRGGGGGGRRPILATARRSEMARPETREGRKKAPYRANIKILWYFVPPAV